MARTPMRRLLRAVRTRSSSVLRAIGPTDVVVLGGGIIGCALAEELARRGQRVVVIERGLAAGLEASSAAAGILSAQMDVPEPGPFFELCQESRRRYPQWIKRLERASGLELDYRVGGVLYLALNAREEAAMDARARWQVRMGLPVERWSPPETQRHEPSLDGRFRRGFHFPLEGQVDNALVMRALAAACRKARVRLLEQTTVKRLLIKRQAVRGVETDRGRIRARVVVNCLGSWAALDGAFPVPLPVVPARGQIVAFHGPRHLFRRPVMSERGYVVQRKDGLLLLGSTIEFAGYEKALTVQGMHDILCGVRQMSRAVDRCHFLDAWAGLRPCSKDRMPILGATPIDGLFVATGHFRHGILLAPTTAGLLADLILTGQSPLPFQPFSPLRFR